MMTCGGKNSIAPRILNLVTIRRWVVSFTPRPFYPRYALDRTLCGPGSHSERGRRQKCLYPCSESNTGLPGHTLVTTVTELFRFPETHVKISFLVHGDPCTVTLVSTWLWTEDWKLLWSNCVNQKRLLLKYKDMINKQTPFHRPRMQLHAALPGRY
jgi:hypothetical protein